MDQTPLITPPVESECGWFSSKIDDDKVILLSFILDELKIRRHMKPVVECDVVIELNAPQILEVDHR